MGGHVTLSDGTAMKLDTAYRHGIMVFYRKEVSGEPEMQEVPVILYRDDHILVVDKPSGIPVTPAGDHVERSLLVHLQRRTQFADLSPLHRLDRETAGVVLFSVRADTRAPYHRLFAEGHVEREYRALSYIRKPLTETHWRLENRIEAGSPWFRQQIVDGPVNAVTNIEVTAVDSDIAEFRLLPKTGKKHQLRLHMVSIGQPIIGDPFYPSLQTKEPDSPPLQLVARRLAFVDPVSGSRHEFTSQHELKVRNCNPKDQK